MMDIQPSFFQWRKKVNGALAIDPTRVTLAYTAPDGRTYSIEQEELQTPQAGTYTAKIAGKDGTVQEVTADYEVIPDRAIRRVPEEGLIGRYERMADDMEHARQQSEARARAAEAEKFAALELVSGQQRRIFELEQRIFELESQSESLLDDDTAMLILEVIDQWSGAAELRAQVAQLLAVMESDPKAAERIVRRAPQLIEELVRQVRAEGEG